MSFDQILDLTADVFSFYRVTTSSVLNTAVVNVCRLHIKPFFLLNDISSPSVRADSSS